MMESLTDDMADQALEIINEINSTHGGMTSYVESGLAKLRIEESATRKQGRIDSGEEVVVGVNKYRVDSTPDDEDDVRTIDGNRTLEAQIAKIRAIKSSRDDAAAHCALRKLGESAALDRSTADPDDPMNLLALSIDAMRARCTLGEVTDALAEVWGRHTPRTDVVRGAYSAGFQTSDAELQSVVEDIGRFEREEGRRPRLLVAKMGQDGHDRGAKVIASGFSDFGYDVDVGPLFQTPSEVALQALDADVHAIGVSSQAAGHRALLPQLRDQLREYGATHVVVVAGGVIPPKDYHFLMEQERCCDAVFGPGTRVIDAAREVLGLIRDKRRDVQEKDNGV